MIAQANGVARRLDASAVKQAAAGRWRDILQALAGIDSELLDGRNHPCPKCGGTDRFAAFSDVAETGGVNCRRCHSERNGDGIATVQWALDVDFTNALRLIDEYLGGVAQLAGIKITKVPTSAPIAAKEASTYATAEDAAEAALNGIRRRHDFAMPRGDWQYRDVGGDLFGCVVRFDTGSVDATTGKPEKTFRPLRRLPSGDWLLGIGDDSWPLYRADELPETGPIVIVEGEKAADALHSVGVAATTWQGGSNAAGRADWSALAGRRVAIAPDNDQAGRKAIEDIAAALHALKPDPIVSIFEWPDVPPKGDAVEWIENHGDAAEPQVIADNLAALVTAAQPIETSAGAQEPEDESPRVSYTRITCAELAGGDYSVDYLIDNTLVARQPMILAGPQKTLKTSLIVDAGISLATGGFFLGKLNVARPCRVAVMTGESGLGTIQETAFRVALSAGKQLCDIDNLFWFPEVPKFGDLWHLEAVERLIVADGIEVLIIDPAYLAMPGSVAGNLMAQGELLRSMSQLCDARGVTMILAHHTKRNTLTPANEPPELSDIAWAGFPEFARQWWLLGRREKYVDGTGEHKLWLRVGGSAGHSALWGVDVSEGVRSEFTSRHWDVTVSHGNDVMADARQAEYGRRQDRADRKAQDRAESDRRSVVEALRKIGQPETQKEIASVARIPGGRAKAALVELIQTGDVTESDPITKANRQSYPSFQLVESDE